MIFRDSENIIVWREGLGPLGDIYGYNLSTNEQFAVVAPSTQTGPAIYGDIVVWTDHRNENYDIYGCSLSSVEWYPFGSPPVGLLEPPPRPFQGFLKLVLLGLGALSGVLLVLIFFFMRKKMEKT